MSMLSSYTILNRAPLLGPRAAAAAPPSAATLVSLPRPVPAVVSSSRRRQSSSSSRARRPPLFVCRSTIYDYDDISRTTLSSRGPTSTAGKNWSVTEDKDLTIFKLTVGESTSREHLQLVPSQDLLDIKYIGGDAACPAINLGVQVQLLMPPGHDWKQVTASKAREYLVIIIPKIKPDPKSLGSSVTVSEDPSPTDAAGSKEPVILS